jgi:hypothetical protein
MKAFLVSVCVIVVVAIIGGVAVVGYYLYQEKNTPPVFPPSLFINTATSTPSTATSTPASLYATSTADMSAWKTYGNAELGYSVAYPADVIVNENTDNVVFAFPKGTYFHWPLQDDAKVTIAVATSCPPLAVAPAPFTSPTTTVMLNHQVFTGHASHDAAAGNLYSEVAFDTFGNGVCYHLSLFDHGANGAGLYVGDPSLIVQYDNQHTADMAVVNNVFYGMLQQFKVTSVPGGLPETR